MGAQCKGERHLQVMQRQKEALSDLRHRIKLLEQNRPPSQYSFIISTNVVIYSLLFVFSSTNGQILSNNELIILFDCLFCLEANIVSPGKYSLLVLLIRNFILLLEKGKFLEM